MPLGLSSVSEYHMGGLAMVDISKPRILEKYGYETNSLSVHAGKFLLKMLGVFALYLVGLGLWQLAA